VEETISVRQKTNRKGLLGSAVIGKQVADFLDLNYVLRTAAGDWFERRSQPERGMRVLVAEASTFSRGLICSGLDMAGYRVLEASNTAEAVRKLEDEQVDIVLAAIDLPPDGNSELLEAIRRNPEWKEIPILALADSAEQTHAAAPSVQGCQLKYDGEAMLESVARLAAVLASEKPALALRSN